MHTFQIDRHEPEGQSTLQTQTHPHDQSTTPYESIRDYSLAIRAAATTSERLSSVWSVSVRRCPAWAIAVR